MSGDDTWDLAAGRNLRLARTSAGHTQAQCAQVLRAAGAPCGSQATVSEWERAASTPSDAARDALGQYLRQYDTAAPVGPPFRPGRSAETFDGIVGRLAGEPLLAPRQGALVDALTARLASGSAMSEADERAAVFLAATLGLGGAAPDGPG